MQDDNHTQQTAVPTEASTKRKLTEPPLEPTKLAEPALAHKEKKIKHKEEVKKKIKKKILNPLQTLKNPSLNTAEAIDKHIVMYASELGTVDFSQAKKGKSIVFKLNRLFKEGVVNILLQTAIPVVEREKLLKNILGIFDFDKHCGLQKSLKYYKTNKNRRDYLQRQFGTSDKYFATGFLYLALRVKEFGLYRMLFKKLADLWGEENKINLRAHFEESLTRNGEHQIFDFYQTEQTKVDQEKPEDNADEKADDKAPETKVLLQPLGQPAVALVAKTPQILPLMRPPMTPAPQPMPTIPLHAMTLRKRARQINYTDLTEDDILDDDKINLTTTPLPAITLPPERKIRVENPPAKQEKKQVDPFAKRFTKDPQNTHRQSIHFTSSQTLTAFYDRYYSKENKDPRQIFTTHTDLMRQVIDEIFNYYIRLIVQKYGDVFTGARVASFSDTGFSQASAALLNIFNKNVAPGLRREVRAAMINPNMSRHLPDSITTDQPYVLKALQELYLIFNSNRGLWMDPKSQIDVRLAIILAWQAIKDRENLITPPGANVVEQQTDLCNTNLLDAILNGIDHCPSGYINGIPNSLYQCHKLVSIKHFSAEDLPQLIQDKYNAYYQALAPKMQNNVAQKIAIDCLGNKSPLTGFFHYEDFFDKFSTEMGTFVESKCFTTKQLNASIEEFSDNLSYLDRFPLLNKNYKTIQERMLGALAELHEIPQEEKTATNIERTVQPLAGTIVTTVVPEEVARPTSPKSPRMFQPAAAVPAVDGPLHIVPFDPSAPVLINRGPNT